MSDDIYDETNDVRDRSFSEIYDSDSESSVGEMAPPPDVPPQEMKLRREKKELRKEIYGLREEIGFKDQIIDILKNTKQELTKKNEQLKQENESLAIVIDQLSAEQRAKLKGGTRHKRYKHSRRK
jgi:hypothetical protein